MTVKNYILGDVSLPSTTMCRVCDAVNYYGIEKSKYYNRNQMNQFWSIRDCLSNREILELYNKYTQSSNFISIS